LFQSVALTAGCAAAATSDELRHVAAAHGLNLSDERLGVLLPVLERRQAQLRKLREFELDDRDGLL
jgi:hypothetical protein